MRMSMCLVEKNFGTPKSPSKRATTMLCDNFSTIKL